MLPLHDANPTRRIPYVTVALIAANLAAFLLWQPTFGTEDEQQIFFYCKAMIPYEVVHQTTLADGGPEAAVAIDEGLGTRAGVQVQRLLGRECAGKSWAVSVLVAMFLHGGWLHIAANMLYLWIFGNNVEDRMGRSAYVLFYLGGGIAASALQIAFGPDSVIPTLGASGAIAAVLGAYIVLYPHARITTLVIFFVITVVELPAVFVLGAWFVLQFFSGVGSLGQEIGGGVAYWAHVGGFVAGVGTAAALYGRRRPSGGLPPAWSSP